MERNQIINRLADLQGTNFEVADVQVFKDEIIWTVVHKKEAYYVCAKCGELHESCYDSNWIYLRDIPYGNKTGTWKIKRVRLLCHCSSNHSVEYLSFRSTNHRLTKRFVRYIEELLCTKMFTVMDVSRMFELDYSTIYKIDHDVLYRLVQSLEIPDPENIAVDEKSFQKGHSYVTVIIDSDLKKVIWVTEGNNQESLDQFFLIIGAERCKKIKTVAKDLHKPYALSCQKYIPQALEVADKFHVVKRLNDSLDKSRRELAVESDLGKKKRAEINKMNWVIRYKKENMNERNLGKLEELEKLNQPLYQAYLLKEAFFDFFNFAPSEVDKAQRFLVEWVVDACKIKLIAFMEFAEYVTRNFKVLLNIIRTRRTSAVSEGINRKINVIKSMAYGYRNKQYFMLKIMQRCGVLGSMYKSESPT